MARGPSRIPAPFKEQFSLEGREEEEEEEEELLSSRGPLPARFSPFRISPKKEERVLCRNLAKKLMISSGEDRSPRFLFIATKSFLLISIFDFLLEFEKRLF